MWIVFVILAAAAGYGALLALGVAAQTAMIFPSRIAEQGSIPLPPGSERLAVQSEGTRLSGTRMSALSGAQPAATVLAFGGNATNADALAAALTGLIPDAEIVVFHYRGYRPSEGQASAAAILADALVVHDAVIGAEPDRPVIAIGLSIGSGVAAHLASQRPLAGLMLVTPFDSLAAVAKEHFRWAPVRLLLRHRIETADYMRQLAVPTAVIAAANDTVIPPRRTATLVEAIPNLVFHQVIPDTDHNDIYADEAFSAAMRDGFAKLLGSDENPINGANLQN